MSRTTIRVALDWTPNTIHSGLYIALQKGIYSSLDLDVELLPPSPEYTTTPAKLLANGEVDLAICPSETIIAYAENNASSSITTTSSDTKEAVPQIRLEAIYALLQKDASAIASAKYKSIGELYNGTYGSYNARYEDAIVRHMITSSGNDGAAMKVSDSTQKFNLFTELCSGANARIDATWIFLPWEGIEADMDGVQLNHFTLEKSGIPYGYSPVIARKISSEKSGLSDEVLKKFVRATRIGYEIASRDVAQAVRILAPFCDPYRSMEFLDMSQESINGFYGGEGSLGEMKKARWVDWVDWLKEKGLVKAAIDANLLFTNRFNVTQ